MSLTSEQIAWLQRNKEMSGQSSSGTGTGSNGNDAGGQRVDRNSDQSSQVNGSGGRVNASSDDYKEGYEVSGQAVGAQAPGGQQAAPGGTAAPVKPAPIPLTPAPQNPAAPQPAPPQAAAPPAAAPEPAIDPSPIVTVVSAEQLGRLLKTLDQVEAKVQDAMAADSAMRAGLKRRKIDVRDKDALAKRLDQVVPAIDPEAMKSLRNAKELVDTAGDGLRETLIEIEAGKERLQNLKEMTGISRKDDAEADTKAQEIANHYDLVVQSEKAVMDILPELLNPFAWVSGVLELLGTDMLKDKVKDHYKELLTKNQELSKHLDEVVVASHEFGRDEMRTESERIKKLVELKEKRVTHLTTALTNFASDLASLPAKGGGATPAAFKEILDNYREVDEQRKKMAKVKKEVEKNPALRNDEMLKSLQPPIGTFDPKLTKKLATTHAGGSATFVYVRDPGHVTVFNLPSGMAQPDLEGIAARVNKLRLFDAAAHDAAALVESWESTIDSRFSM